MFPVTRPCRILGRIGVAQLAALLLLLPIVPQAVSAQQIGRTYSAEAQTTAALQALAPPAQAVMAALPTLGAIPLGAFRYHAGDVANGGSTDLDDSSWREVQLPFTASADEIWLRQWVQVPRSLNGYDPAARYPSREDGCREASSRRSPAAGLCAEPPERGGARGAGRRNSNPGYLGGRRHVRRLETSPSFTRGLMRGQAE